VSTPLFHFNRHRDDIAKEVVARVVDQLAETADDPLRSLQLVLNDAAFHEIHRLERATGRQTERLPGWQKLARRIGHMDEGALREEITRLARYYVQDVIGHFDSRVYRFATNILPVGLGALFNTTDLRQGFSAFKDLSARIRVEGAIDTLRSLADKGTLVVVPTHSSNLDSIVLGWSLYHAHLPPVTYGAGKNLFTNKLVGYFMRNLGAYRVDRRLRHMLYKVTLKTYSQVLIERGYHSLFFPGGTRERSGMVEQKLKLGLMGSALAAFSERVRRGDTRPIYIVPVTINYPLVLEAETLIDDYLKAKGQARYIIEDDEFSRMGRVANFAVKVMALDTTMIIRYGQPLDVFGNVVAADGTSRGPDGTVLEPTRYMERDGVPVDDPARDAEYTRQLGRAVADAFRRETVVLPTQLIGWVLFERERQRGGPKLDLFTLLRTTSGDTHQWAELCTAVDRVRVRLVALEKAGEIRLDDTVRTAPVDTLVSEAVSTFGMYHTRAAVERVGEDVIVRDPKLLFYYGNRLSSWTDTLREVLA
jgi:glycerol-3-phosphate O-acyltransferase